jgi:hypothetical protein
VIGDLADSALGVRHVAVRARSTGESGVNKVKNQDGNALMILSGKRLSGIRKDLLDNSILSNTARADYFSRRRQEMPASSMTRCSA